MLTALARWLPATPVHASTPQVPLLRWLLRKLTCQVLPVLAAAALAACEGNTAAVPSSAPAPIKVGTRLAADQSITRGLDAMPRTLDPSLLTDTESQHVVDDLFEGLTTLGIDGSIVPGVASSWETSADGKTWVFHLRPEARWSNGDPVTAADFIYAWKREVNPKTGAEYSQALAPLINAMAIATGKQPVDSLGATAPDAHTIRVSLVSPTPYLLALLALLADSFMQPLHRATIERYGDDWTKPEHMVSNGAFVLAEVVVGDRITLTKNPLYWDAAQVHPTRVTYYPLDGTVQVSRFMAGDLMYASGFPVDQVKWLKSQLGDQVRYGPYFGTQMLFMNLLEPPFANNRALRLALSMAVDRRVLAEKLAQGVPLPAYTLMPPLPGYVQQLPAWASWSDEKRHAEARRLYAQAGYSTAHPLRVQLDYPTSQHGRDILDALAAMWRVNLGADVEPYNEEFRVLLQDVRLHKSRFFTSAWIGDYPDPFTFLQLFQTGFEQNTSGYSNPKFDELLARAANEPDDTQRYRYFEQAEAMLNEDAPYIPTDYASSEHLLKPYLKGTQLNLQNRSLSRYIYVVEHEGR